MLENVKDDPVYWIFLYLLLVEERMLSGYKNYNNNDKFFGNKILLLQRCFETSYRAWNLELKMMISWLWWWCNGSQFLDTQVSLAPTHVSKLVSKLVSPSHFRISNLWSPFCATVVFDDPTAMLLGSPPSPRRSTPSPRRSTPSPRRSTPSPRRSTPSPSFFQNCR